MDIIFWRHAKAEEIKADAKDAERALTPEGQSEAKAMARWLRKRLPQSYQCLVSPALRAQQTAAALREDFATLEALGMGTNARDLLKACGLTRAALGEHFRALKTKAGVRSAPERTLLIVGHLPHLSEAAALLLFGQSLDWSWPCGAALWLRLDAANPSARLLAAMSPDMLAARLRRKRRSA